MFAGCWFFVVFVCVLFGSECRFLVSFVCVFCCCAVHWPGFSQIIPQSISLSSCVSSFAARSIGPASPKSFLSQFRHLHLPHFRRRAQAFFHNLPACSSRSPIGSVVFWPCLPINRNLLLFYTSSLSIFEEMSSVNSRPLCTKRVQFPLSNDAMFFCGPLVQGRSGRLWQCACSCRADLVRSGLFRQRACFMQLRHDHFGVDLSISTPSTGCII